MPKPEYLNHSHPEIKRFATLLRDGKVDKLKVIEFQKFRDGKKIPEELKPIVDELLAEHAARGTAASANVLKTQFGPPAAARGGMTAATDHKQAASAACLGEPFHNPYTFVPFGSKPVRRQPTLLTADESDRSRFTGLIRLKVRTLSPLLTCNPIPVGPASDFKTYEALTIGDDVVVPSSGVRGSLRTLLTVLTGGTLGYLDETLWLCQGRDLPLGPKGETSPPTTPERAFLGRVVEAGSATRSGRIELGETTLISIEDLAKQLPNVDGRRPKLDKNREPIALGKYFVKLSGRRVGTKGVQREGLFEPGGRFVELPPAIWAAYQGRYRHGDVPELRAGDLVWLEPRRPDLQRIESADDIASLQWARWGRRGKRLLDLVRERHPQVMPDAFNPDGLVDEVTDLFGQVPRPELARAAFGAAAERGEPAPAFAARVRPENLVFRGAKRSLDRSVRLAPLTAPHPGCIAFYRDNDDLDGISVRDPLRGYKVYRTTKERGDKAPWHYAVQGVYNDSGDLRKEQQRVSKTCDLLREGLEGTLQISVRSLSERELAILLLACAVDWRLGGGKPLGLGHCRVTHVQVLDENGTERLAWQPTGGAALERAEPAPLPSPFAASVPGDLAERARFYQATQRPVERLRYPRAVSENRNRKQRGGHAWFARHAQGKKSADSNPAGLQVLWVADTLRTQAGGKNQIRAQALPPFDPARPGADALFGYDCIAQNANIAGQRDGRSIISRMEPFNPSAHARDTDASGGSDGKTGAARRDSRESR